jgi:anti-anti-sigma factor
MATPVSLSTSRSADGQIVVTASGEIDMSNIDDFNRVLTDAVDQTDGQAVQVDLRGVEYADSGAINILFEHADHIRVRANTILMPVLEVSGITAVTTVERAD